MNRALIVNDNKFITDRTAKFLEEMGWEVYTAATGSFAYDAWVACRPDLLIIDTDMGDGKVLDVIATIRHDDKCLAIIAATRGNFDESFQKMAELCGANQYIVGPLSASKLRRAIHASQLRHDCLSGPS